MVPAAWAALLLAPAVAAAAPSSSATDVDAARFGARPGGDAASNTKAIQAALDAAGTAGGGTAAVTRPGVYDLAAQGPHPYQSGHRYCLALRHDGVTLRVGKGVTLRLADGQQTDAAGPVDVVVWRSRKDLRLTGGGTISGNTAGQRGWTGGYSQVTNGTLVAGYADAHAGNERVTIEDLTLADHFSNAIHIDGHPDSRDSAIKIAGVRARDTGAGLLVMNADGVTLQDVSYENATVRAHPGDGFELWNVTRFTIAGATVSGMLGGSGIDLYGAREGTVDGFRIEGVRQGVSVAENTDMRAYSERLLVRNGTVRLSGPGTGIFTKGVRVRDVTFSAVKVAGSLPPLPGAIGFQVSADNAKKSPTDDWRQEGPVTLEDCEARGLDIGLLIKTVANMTVRGGDYSDNRASPHSDGIVWMGQGNARRREDTRGLFMSGVKATGNRRFGLHIDAQGIMGKEADGFLSDCSLGGNGADGYHVTYQQPGQIAIGNLAVDQTCLSYAASASPTPTPAP